MDIKLESQLKHSTSHSAGNRTQNPHSANKYRFPLVKRGYRELQGVTRTFKGLHGVTGGYKGLQGVTGFTGGYRGF